MTPSFSLGAKSACRGQSEEIDDGDPVKEGFDKDPGKFQKGKGCLCLRFDIREKQIVDHGDPYLGEDGVYENTQKGTDL